jgi:hypothetical protein
MLLLPPARLPFGLEVPCTKVHLGALLARGGRLDERAIAKERLHALQQRLQLGTLEQLAKKGAAGSQALVSKIEALLCVLCEPELVEGAVSNIE